MTRYVEIDGVCCTVYSCYDSPLYDGVDMDDMASAMQQFNLR